MGRIDLRVSVTVGHHRRSGLVISVRARKNELGQLRDALPGGITADGRISDGTLVLIDDEHGSHRMTYCGVRDGDHFDYLQLPTCHVGFCPPGPLAPLDVTVTVEPGLVAFDAVPEERWVLREYLTDQRLARVARRLAAGERAADIAKDLVPSDRLALRDHLEGHSTAWQVPPHVALIARRMSNG